MYLDEKLNFATNAKTNQNDTQRINLQNDKPISCDKSDYVELKSKLLAVMPRNFLISMEKWIYLAITETNDDRSISEAILTMQESSDLKKKERN